MLEQLNQIIRQFGQDTIIDNTDVPNEHNEGVMQEAQSAILSGLQNMTAHGDTQQLTDLMQNPDNIDQNSPAVQNISNNFLGGITEKFGISKETAASIAATLIPMVISKISRKANDSNDNSFSLPDIIGSLTNNNPQRPQGEAGGSAISQLGKSFLDKDKDGDVDLNDLKGLIGG